MACDVPQCLPCFAPSSLLPPPASTGLLVTNAPAPHARQVIDLDELLDDRLFAASLDPLRHAAMQVILQDERLQLLDGLAHGEGLAQDVHAVLVFLDHLADAAK